MVECLSVHHSRALNVQLKEQWHVTGFCSQLIDEPVLPLVPITNPFTLLRAAGRGSLQAVSKPLHPAQLYLL